MPLIHACNSNDGLKNAAKMLEIEGYIPIILSDSLEGEASRRKKNG